MRYISHRRNGSQACGRSSRKWHQEQDALRVIFNPHHFDDEVTYAQRGAESLGIQLATYPIGSTADLDAALLAASAEGADRLFIISSRPTGIVAATIAKHGQERGLPVIASWREFVVARCCPTDRVEFSRQTSGGLCAKGSERSEARRFAHRAACRIRACCQSQDC